MILGTKILNRTKNIQFQLGKLLKLDVFAIEKNSTSIKNIN